MRKYTCNRCNKRYEVEGKAYNINDYHHIVCQECEQLFDKLYEQFIKDFLKQNKFPMNWISVKDRVPASRDDKVLTVNDKEMSDLSSYFFNEYTEKYQWVSETCCGGDYCTDHRETNITHWAEIPDFEKENI